MKYLTISNIIKISIYIIIGILIYNILSRIISRALKRSEQRLEKENIQRIKTLKSLILNIIKYLIIIIEIIAILAVFGVNVTSFVAGLGITTALVGLALQDYAKDIIAGVSIITENQYDVGDTIEIDKFKGEVISLGLKTTKIRDLDGVVYIVSNRYMDKVKNYSLSNYMVNIEVSTPYEEDQDKIEKVFNKMVKDLDNKIPNAKSPLKILGISKLGESAIIYKICVEIEPINAKYTETERFLRKEIVKYFKKENITIPYNQIEVHNGK